MKSVHATLFPETAAGGFARDDHRVHFYTRVCALAGPESTYVDFGAGRDKFEGREAGFKRYLTSVGSRCRRFIAVDVDSAVEQHPTALERYVIGPDGRLPLEDNSVDLIVAHAVFEHIEKPADVVVELERVLKPGGWVCAWTPNKWAYFAIGSRLIPEFLHERVIRAASRGKRKDVDVFPTFYRMNTKSALKKIFPEDRFNNYTYTMSGGTGYNFGRVWIARFWIFWNWITPASMGQHLYVFVQKRGE
jgi:SAM-dependent methyltransferase